ncbi:MAG: lipopolysaccharide assembly protein LapA domain-containing protein [Planctomycetota bacterium]
MLQKIKIGLLLLLLVLLVILAVLNSAVTEFSLIFTSVEQPLSLLLLAAALIGFLCGILTTLLWQRAARLRKQAKQNTQKSGTQKSGTEKPRNDSSRGTNDQTRDSDKAAAAENQENAS